jgi:acetyl esterase/lipase
MSPASVPPRGWRREIHRYGGHRDQVAELYLPTRPSPSDGWPVVTLLHGGFWREPYRMDLTAPLAEDLAIRGWAAWNVEYRRVRGAGGWPATLLDVAAAIDHLEGMPPYLDPRRTAVVGHSAGGHLALWLAGRTLLPDGAPGAQPRVVPQAAVGLAPVADLRGADTAGLSDLAVSELLGGGPDDVPDRWSIADPLLRVGHGVPTLLVHAEQDEDVPIAQSERYLTVASEAGGTIELRRLGVGDHMGVIDPVAPHWPQVVAWLETHVSPAV